MSTLTSEVNTQAPVDNTINTAEVAPEATSVNMHGSDNGAISVEMSVDTPTQEEPKSDLPDKFQGKSQEDIIKMYQELEKKLGSNTQQPEADTTSPTENVDNVEQKADEVAEGNPDVKSWQAKWQEQGGSLTEEQWSEVQKLTGQSMDDLKSWESYVKDTQMQAVQSAVDKANQTIYDTLGGEEQYNKLAEWANANMNSSEMEAIEAMLSTPELAERGAKLLQTSYTMANGQEPSVTPVNTPSSNLQGSTIYHSDAEFYEAMRDPRYDTSTAYRNEVDKRLEASMRAGTITL